MRAAFFSRLALALLLALGFVPPPAGRQVDEQVQTSARGGTAAARAAAEVAASSLRVHTAPRTTSREVPVERPAPLRKRYLEHRAWLI